MGDVHRRKAVRNRRTDSFSISTDLACGTPTWIRSRESSPRWPKSRHGMSADQPAACCRSRGARRRHSRPCGKVCIAKVRRDGYKKIIVAGYSRGGWLALLAATLPDVDAAIGLAPGTGSHEPAERERTRDVLAQKLAGARAKRIATFFFADDPREELCERRAVALRRGLHNS